MTFRLKRRAAPRSWTVPRKGTKWIKRPSPGPHAQDRSIPLLLVLRDLRRIVTSAREARILVGSGAVRVDGQVIDDLSRGIGLMDTVSFAKPLDQHFRMLHDRRGKLVLVPIPSTEAAVKIGRVRFKHAVRGGKVEVTLHDGRNFVVAASTPYHVGDSVKISLPGQKVVEHFALKPGVLAFVAGGSHVGELARVEKVEVRNSSQPNLVHFKEGFSTIKEYVFVVGETTPAVTIAEGVDR
ncbi:MAG TPA: 30S ribosomal protein S4e [Thermoplasmata archaeon]|nr:30S ribosomal protein S4e [Thermoplasmata archaeon]